jgi:hypothetical protein
MSEIDCNGEAEFGDLLKEREVEWRVGGLSARRPKILGIGQARTGAQHKTSAHGHKLAV